MDEYIVPTRIVVEANSEQEAIQLVDRILRYGKLFNRGVQWKVVNARLCTAFLTAKAFLMNGYSHPHITTED